ncbi:MAG: alpha/beta hydrolase [Pseudolysinimonas sp.]
MTGRALLVHGLGSSSDGWWRVRGWLEEAGWQTETVTLIGHGGRDPSPDYELDSYVADVRTATTDGAPYDLVVAHSLGGTVATVIAAEDPRWTRRLVLLDPVWYVPRDDLTAVADDQASDLLLTPESLRAAKPHWDERDIAGKLAAIAAVDPAAVQRTFRDIDRWDVREAAGRILTPTLVLGGDPAGYTMLEPPDARAASESAPAMQYRIVPGAGHSPHRDAPDATRTLLFEWLDWTALKG